MMHFISRPFLKTAVLCAAVLSWVIISTPATAQNNDIRSVMNRLNQMDNQIQTLSQQVYRNERGGQRLVQPRSTYDGSISEGGRTAARLNSRLSTMEEEMRQINGTVEEQNYAVEQLKRDFDIFKSDLELRLSELERQADRQNTYTSSRTPAPVTNALPAQLGASPPSNFGLDTTLPASDPSPLNFNSTPSSNFTFDNPSTLYDQSFQAIRDQDFGKAQLGFEEFLQRYSNHKLAGNAKYWLGETFYVRGQYDQALKHFAEGYQQYPQGNKAPDNLLKLALTLAKADRTPDACLSLKQLKNDFPNAAAAIKNRAEKESARLSCD